MESNVLLWEFNKLVVATYKEHGLTCLTGLNGEYILDEKPLLMWHGEVTRKCSVIHSGLFNHMKNLDDILVCSDQLLYFTGLLFLYRPYINNPLKDRFLVDGQYIYPNYQNHYGKRYMTFADTAGEKAYNLWDRIGDLIASFFPKLIDSNRVFFPTALDAIPKDFREHPQFLWLQAFRENEYKELNNKRKQIVHYTTSSVEHRYNHLHSDFRDRESMERLQAEIEVLAEFYRRQIELSILGFSHTLTLLEHISSEIFPD